MIYMSGHLIRVYVFEIRENKYISRWDAMIYYMLGFEGKYVCSQVFCITFVYVIDISRHCTTKCISS